MIEHILSLVAETAMSRRDVVELVIGILRGIGIDARLSEHYGGSDGYSLSIRLRNVREL